MKIITQFNSIESFSTKRLIATQLQASDLDKFREMQTNAAVMQSLGGVRDAAQILTNFNWNLKQWSENGFGLWLFYLKDTGAWVGYAGLRRVEIIRAKTTTEEIEVAYALLPSFWHLGFATEMALACVEVGFEVLRLKQLVCCTHITNTASQSVMRKAGFNYECTHPHLPHVLYSLRNPSRRIPQSDYYCMQALGYQKWSIFKKFTFKS